MAKKNIAAEFEKQAAGREHDRAAIELMEREGITFAEAWRRIADAKEGKAE